MPNTTISVGLIGVGHVSRHHVAGIANTPGLSLVAVCDPDADARVSIKAEEQYSDHRDLLRESSVDAVVITTPTSSHVDIACDALESGRVVLVEKPIAATRNDLEILTASASNRLHTAFHATQGAEVIWFADHFEELVERDGSPVYFECRFFDPYAAESRLPYAIESLGSSWRDSGINALSVLLRLFDDLTPRAFHPCLCGDEKVDLASTAHFEASARDYHFAGHIETNWTRNANCKRTTLYLAGGASLVLHHSRQQVLHTPAEGGATVIFDGSERGERLDVHYRGVFRSFYDDVVANRTNLAFSRLCHDRYFAVMNMTDTEGLLLV